MFTQSNSHAADNSGVKPLQSSTAASGMSTCLLTLAFGSAAIINIINLSTLNIRTYLSKHAEVHTRHYTHNILKVADGSIILVSSVFIIQELKIHIPVPT